MKIAITGAATLAADQITNCNDVPMGRLSEEKRSLIATLRQSNPAYEFLDPTVLLERTAFWREYRFFARSYRAVRVALCTFPKRGLLQNVSIAHHYLGQCKHVGSAILCYTRLCPIALYHLFYRLARHRQCGSVAAERYGRTFFGRRH